MEQGEASMFEDILNFLASQRNLTTPRGQFIYQLLREVTRAINNLPK